MDPHRASVPAVRSACSHVARGQQRAVPATVPWSRLVHPQGGSAPPSALPCGRRASPGPLPSLALKAAGSLRGTVIGDTGKMSRRQGGGKHRASTSSLGRRPLQPQLLPDGPITVQLLPGPLGPPAPLPCLAGLALAAPRCVYSLGHPLSLCLLPAPISLTWVDNSLHNVPSAFNTRSHSNTPAHTN